MMCIVNRWVYAFMLERLRYVSQGNKKNLIAPHARCWKIK